MASELIASLQQSHRSGDLDKLEEFWLELAEAVPEDSAPLLGIIDELVEWGETGRARAMLEILAPPLRAAERWSDLEPVLRRLLKLNPEVDDLGPDFASCFQHLYADSSSIDLFIEKSRIRFARPIGPALDAMATFLDFREDQIVLHEGGWGIGTVRGFDPLDAMLIVDFVEKKGHKVNPQAAAKLLKKLDPEDYRALKVTDPDKLEALKKDDPGELLRRVLEARKGPGNAARIKTALVPDVIPAKSWSGWWTKARRAADKHPLIRCVGTGAGSQFSLLEAPQVPAEEAVALFRTKHSRLRRARLALAGHRGAHSAEVTPALVTAIRALPAEDLVANAEYHFLLVALGETEPGRFDASVLDDRETALKILTEFEHPDLRARAFAAIREASIEDRPAFLRDVFERVPADLWDKVFAELDSIGDEGKKVRDEIVSGLVLHPRREIDRYGWLVQRVLSGRLTLENLPDGPSLLRKLMDAINHLYRHHATDRDYRERLLRMQAPLTDKDGALLESVLDGCTPDEGHGLRSRFLSCLAFTEKTKRDLGVRVARRFGASPAMEDMGVVEGGAEEPRTMVSDEIIWATERGLAARRVEHHKLVNEDIPAGQQALNQAASYGDLSENAEWTYALEQQGHMTQKAEKMEAEFRKVRVITPDSVPLDRMGIGSRGHFQDTESSESVTYTVLGPWDVDPDNGILSYDSPLALQFLDREAGSEFTVRLPAGDRQWRLVSVENGLG